MHRQLSLSAVVLLLAASAQLQAQDVAPVKLGRPRAIAETPPVRFVRAQAPDPLGGVPPPPPPAFPGASGPITAVPGPVNDPYNCGVVNSNADQQGFFGRVGDFFTKGWNETTGAVTQPGRFRSSECAAHFASPVTSPYYFEDPRALTEFRPIFAWQHTPGANPVFAGGDNFFFDTQFRLAVTKKFSVVLSHLGWTWTEIQNPASGYSSHSGFSDIHLGGKYTFYETEKTVMAGGLTFEIPIGATQVFQGTGNLSLRPYFSAAQSFGYSTYGNFNFLTTIGYNFSIDDARNDFFHANFHLDYDVGKQNRIYPLIELSWYNYTNNGNTYPFNFGGRDQFNFGSTNVSGSNELALAVGARYKVNSYMWLGGAIEFNLLDNNLGQHLDDYRLTFDLIFRY